MRACSSTQGAIGHTVNSDLLFRPGNCEMNPRGRAVIVDLAKKLGPTQQNKLVDGYTDNTPIGPGLRERGGSSNLELSQRRAQAVREFLVSQGVPPDMVSARGHGESDPVASNDTPRGRAQNRRV
ncbi:MAG TPA: OmpA family protein [Crenalkalicoccus sp.]|jgi:chemotaxis protein MotB|nr:OmpA family protein [Crenalkalicoccus sp.]